MKNKKILIIEDDKVFAQAIYFQLTSSASSTNHVQVSMSIEELDELSEYFHPDVVLLDLNIGQYQGLDTFLAVNKIFPNSAIIILTGTEDQELALKIVKYGAQDYLVKSEIDNKLLIKSIDYSEERKLQHIKLAESEKKFRNVFLNSPLPMFVVDGMQEEIIMINNSFIQLYGYSSEFLIGKRLNFLNADENEIIEIDVTSESFHNSLVHKTLKGKRLQVELIGNKLSKDSSHYICLVNDRTEEKEFTKKKFRLVSSTQENEKKKIAMELHDGLAQNLVLLGLWFNSFDIDSSQEPLRNNFVNLLNQSLKELKSISYSLLPPELDKGFIKAVKNLVGRVNLLNQIQFSLEIDDEIEEDEFKDNDKYNLYRIIQETINNALKHSKAKNLIISIKKSDKHITLSLKDDGIGFEQDKVSGSLGMQNLNYRMNIGNLSGSIESAPREGTKLILYLERDCAEN
jgi:two-component system sensor histidine kinase UhpB